MSGSRVQMLRHFLRCIVSSKGGVGDMYLGFLGPIEDYRVYGYVTNTGIKFILVLQEGPVKENVVKSVRL